ncbi:putative Mg-protoporphyrin IX monomethyl ester [Tanacetum coccineum]
MFSLVFHTPADVFLWMNNKISTGVLAGATALWVLFELLEYHLVTLDSHILILLFSILFMCSNAFIPTEDRNPKCRNLSSTFVQLFYGILSFLDEATAMLISEQGIVGFQLGIGIGILNQSTKANPEYQCYLIFKYFENRCQDENRHGDFLSALMKAQPQFLND